MGISGVLPGGDTPGLNAVEVTPSDTDNILPCAARALWIGGDGDLAVIMAGDSTDTVITFTNVTGGRWMPIQVKRVMEATTASDIVAVF